VKEPPRSESDARGRGILLAARIAEFRSGSDILRAYPDNGDWLVYSRACPHYPDNGDWLVYSRACPHYPDRLLRTGQMRLLVRHFVYVTSSGATSTVPRTTTPPRSPGVIEP
jgi:hypothetical protein